MNWISVKDRLPKYGMPIIITAVIKDRANAVPWSATSELTKTDISGHHWTGIEKVRVDVTHWMPLPEPPKE